MDQALEQRRTKYQFAVTSRAVIDFGFQTLHADCVCAETLADNKAAPRLCRMLGMRIEPEYTAEVFFRNRWWTTLVLSMSARRW